MQKFVFEFIKENNGNEIYFNPPLTIEYSIYKKIDEETGKENYPEDIPVMAYATFDFGLEVHIPLDIDHNWLINGYNGLTKESSFDDILMNTIIFDLFHAFCHIPEDPNYSHYNWALKGWLKERATVKELY